ncbi:DUF2484 family protein [Thetidibacter halocola]|uniref:DUF2484 family protein n=1 Tax=Thetidibacter halocola TaxID=2827239 RepID=A0A8J8B6D3_9RHOB|nr:DUF2484 family protein [Thetidibacter halocola]MBS0123197.1 DUF2484 family protein [Thetidibacter halocola]
MTPSLIAGFAWLLAANVLAMLPSKDNHWFRAYVLIAVGLPLLGWIWWQNGWVLAAVFLLAGMSVLRWPVRYLLRWVRGLFGGGQ